VYTPPAESPLPLSRDSFMRGPLRGTAEPWPFPADVIYRAVKNFTVFCARIFARPGSPRSSAAPSWCYSCYDSAAKISPSVCICIGSLSVIVSPLIATATSRFSVTSDRVCSRYRYPVTHARLWHRLYHKQHDYSRRLEAVQAVPYNSCYCSPT